MVLGADENDPIVVALAAQGLGGPQPGERSTDDDDRARRGPDAGTLQRVVK
jgi:hypothetical protein